MRDIEVTDREGIQALHDNLITKWRNGWSVADRDSGSCKVIIDTGNLGSGESAIAVQTGTALANGDKISKDSRETVDIEPVTSSPRQDTIALNTDGSVAYYKGVEEPLRPSGREIEDAERPAPPDLQGEDVVPLAVVTVPRESENITDGNLIDIRVRADMTFDELRAHSVPEGPKDVIRNEDITTVRAFDYGADPSGETASTSALQQAIDAADPGDRVIWGREGTYYLDNEITVQKQIELDLHEGEIESDYHDGEDNQNHYMPLFRFRGSLGGSDSLTSTTDRGEDQVVVQNPGEFEVGEYVILRNATTNRTTVPGYSYFSTQSRIREIQDGVIFLEDDALTTYTSSDYLTHAEFITRPILRNIHIRPRNEPTFDSDVGKVLGGFQHGFATELTENALIDNCSVSGYDSHLWSSRDDISPTLRDCTAREPMNLSGSCGEPVHIESSSKVSIVRPTIKEARRGIDARCSGGKITVTEPDITAVSFVGISWHSTSSVDADIEVRGGHVRCRPDDPTMDNKDGSDSTMHQEMQAGKPFNTGTLGNFISRDVTYVGRQNAVIQGAADISGGEIYKYRTAGTVLTLNGQDIDIEETRIGAYGRVDRLVGTDSDTNADDCTLKDVVLDCSGNPSRAVEFLGGSDLTVTGRVTSGSSACVDIEAGDNLNFDLDTEADGNYAYIIYGGTDINIEGNIRGSASNEVIRIDGGTGIGIDSNITASGATDSRGVRILGGQDIDITGRYSGQAIAVMFSGAATSVSVHDMRIEVTTTRAGAVGTDGGGFTLTNIKWVNNDIRGTTESIVMNDDVDGLWVVNNICSNVEYTSGTLVGQVFGNGRDAPEVFTTAGGDIQGEVRVDGDGTASEEGLRLSVANDLYPEVDSSATSGDDPNFNVTISDIQNNRPEIHWRRMVNSSTSDDEAFGVYDQTNSSTLFEIDELGNTVVNGNLNANSDLNVAGSGVIDDLTIRQDPGFVLEPAADVESHLESGASSADRNGFNFQMLDDDGTENRISWQVNAAARRAFSVWDIDADSHFFTVDYDGNVSIPNGGLGINGPTDFNQNELTHIDYMDMRARDGSGDDWRFITWDDNGRFVFQLYPSGGGYMDGFEVAKDGNIRFPNGGLTVNDNIDANGNGIRNLQAETDGLQWSLDSADGSLDWAKLQFDDANGDDVYWTTNRSLTDAFRVTNSTAGNDLMNINDGGLVEVPNGDVEIQGSVSATQPWVNSNTPAGDQALETGDLVQVATTSGGQGDGTFSTSSGTYVDVDNNTTGDLAAMMWDSLPSYSWDDGSVYVSVHATVSIDAGTVYLTALDTQNDVRLTSGEASSTTTGFQGIGTTPVAHSPTDLNTRWSFSVRGDGSNTVTYGKNRTVNFYRQVA